MRPVSVAVTAPGNPSNHIVAVRRCERKNLDELDAFLFAGQLHQDEVGFDRLLRRGLLFVRTGCDLAGHIPQIFALEERVNVLRMIESKKLGLRIYQSFWITAMLVQLRTP